MHLVLVCTISLARTILKCVVMFICTIKSCAYYILVPTFEMRLAFICTISLVPTVIPPKRKSTRDTEYCDFSRLLESSYDGVPTTEIGVKLTGEASHALTTRETASHRPTVCASVQHKGEHSTHGANKKRQGPATESQEPNATLIEALLPLSSQGKDAQLLMDGNGHKDEHAEILVTSANAGEGENQLHRFGLTVKFSEGPGIGW